jgi:hypothetical protein
LSCILPVFSLVHFADDKRVSRIIYVPICSHDLAHYFPTITLAPQDDVIFKTMRRIVEIQAERLKQMVASEANGKVKPTSSADKLKKEKKKDQKDQKDTNNPNKLQPADKNKGGSSASSREDLSKS